jgi:phosphoribosylanthranilate isomerase
VIVRAKICGIRSEDDLAIAVAAGADALGFICGTTHFSEDELDVARARELAAQVPLFVARTLVTHLTDADEILSLAAEIRVDTVQVHGLVSLETVRKVFEQAGRLRITKAIHVTGEEAIEDAERFAPYCHALQMDSRTEHRLGGTGQVHDWQISRSIVDRLASRGIPCVLSGGLSPENVAEAIHTVRPYAVDANSGLEDERGDKDPERSNGFVTLARTALVDGVVATVAH